MSGARIFLADENAGGWLVDPVDRVTDAHKPPMPGRTGDTSGAPSAASSGLPPAQFTHWIESSPNASAVIIVPAARMRTLVVAVPPAAENKLQSVVRFALEDQLAGDVDLQ